MGKCPTWAWVVMGILILIVIKLVIQIYTPQSFEDFNKTYTEYTEPYVNDIVECRIEWLDIVDCYQKALPTCNTSIAGNTSVFTLGIKKV